MRDAHLKLDWAERRNQDMTDEFAAFANVGSGDDRPIGITFERVGRTNMVVAKFILEAQASDEVRLLAADLIHNTRTALDHVVARLKERFGGDPGQGGFPVCRSADDWLRRQERDLRGLDAKAVGPVQHHQHFNQENPEADPLAIMNRLDNDDKHQLLHPAFVYTHAQTGLDLIETEDEHRVGRVDNVWTAGAPLESGTVLARVFVRGDIEGALRSSREAQMGFSSGVLGAPRVTYSDIIKRVRIIVQEAGELIESG